MRSEQRGLAAAIRWLMAILSVAGPISGQDVASRLVEACMRREGALERRIMEIVDIKYAADERADALETIGFSAHWPRERWTRRGWERVAPSDALPEQGQAFPQALWTSADQRIRQHFDIYDGGRQVAVACELNGTLWTGQLLRDVDPFMRRGGARCGWAYGEEWLSRRLARWKFQGTVLNGSEQLWFFTGHTNAGFTEKHRIWTHGDAMGIRGILTTRCATEPALEWRACDVTAFPGETVERVAVIEASVMIDGLEFPTWGWFAEVERTPGKVRTWLRYHPKPAPVVSLDRLYAVGMLPVELGEQPYKLIDRFTGRITKFGDVDGVQQHYAELRKQQEGELNSSAATQSWLIPLGIALGAVGLACILVAVRRRRRKAA